MKKSCQYPDCKYTATRTWALVDLCEIHHETIRIENMKYYRRLKTERVNYQRIKHLTPWG